MSENPAKEVVTQVGIIVISALLLIIAWQCLAYGLITTNEFMWIVGAVMAAWGLGIVGAGTFKMGKKTGYQLGYQKGLECALRLRIQKAEGQIEGSQCPATEKRK